MPDEQRMEIPSEEEKGKYCAWQYLGKNHTRNCYTCERYNLQCPEYVPLKESEQNRVQRILRNLHRKPKSVF